LILPTHSTGEDGENGTVWQPDNRGSGPLFPVRKTGYVPENFRNSDELAWRNGESSHRHTRAVQRSASTKRPSRLANSDRPFIAWDGEGINPDGGGPQNYSLLVCATPDGTRHIKSPHLSTLEILDFLISVESDYPHAYHVGFGMGYDFNQFLSSLRREAVEILHKTGFIYLCMRQYRVEWRKGKYLRVTRYHPHKISLTIYDTFAFFHTSFVKACESFLGSSETLERIKLGKSRRQDFRYEEIDNDILPYCEDEVIWLVRLMDRLRDLLDAAGIHISHWWGPGAVASAVLRKSSVHSHMCSAPEAVREAARYAYAAGRFEMPKLGRVHPVWGIDINSAYPTAISDLPTLSQGNWRRVENPTRLVRFGVYRVKSAHLIDRMGSRVLAPLFHRDRQHRISYHWFSDGWYWTPEAELVIDDPNFIISEGWEWIPNNEERPFKWVRDMYRRRQIWKKQGNQAQYVLKIAMNSLYGKMAQRVGWDKKNWLPPKWHQLEWAGWVTSWTRARIYRICKALGLDTIVSIETDGVYTTRDPSEIGIVASEEMGGWSVTEYRQALYVQSGLAWLEKTDGSWEIKFRGLDPDSLTWSLLRLASTEGWDSPLEGTTTRFVGAGAALMSKEFNNKWRQWTVTPKLVAVGGDGKRTHHKDSCRACHDHKSPMDMPHDLIITPRITGMSEPHPLPWLGMPPPTWEIPAMIESELIPNV